ncbi:MAG: hypothetical protein LBG16_04070 [Elusimicrobiota bacterium]|jgi:hypothetical protein|nr:hypothetical protein [Elusimicrobiota bacterium]
MKKLLAVLLASALFVPATAGSIFNNVETTGEIQTIGTLSRNAAGSSRDVSSRLLFGFGADLVEDVKANITFASSNYWGTDNKKDSGATLEDYFQRISVAEAYVSVANVFNAFELKVGRQFYGDEKSAVVYFGPTHYRGRIPTTMGRVGSTPDIVSIDGALLAYNSDNFLANLVYSKVAEYGNGDVDESVLGIDGKYFVNETLSLQAYLYDFRYGSYNGIAIPIQHVGLWGAKAAYTDDALNIGVEFAKNYKGHQYFQYNNEGWMVKADAALKVATENVDLTPRLTYVRAEKDFVAFGNYAPGIFFGRPVFYQDPANANIVNAGVDFKLPSLSKFNFAVDYYALSMGDKDNAEWVANEFDLVAKYALNEYVELHGGVSYLTNVADDLGNERSRAYSGQLGMIVKF